VGVDVSAETLRYARELAAEAGLDAGFVRCNVYDVAGALDREFDVVYTSRGVLVWLPDLDDRPRRLSGADFGPDEDHHQVAHPLGEVVTALASAGLRIESVREFPFDHWRRWESMVREEAGRWTLPDAEIPLSFSVRAGAP
jgi:SAM-dependent methyltransferase